MTIRPHMSARCYVALAVVAAAVAMGFGRPALATTGSASAACGALPLASTSYRHVIWVWMENHSYSKIIGSTQAPYINTLANSCGVATNYHTITHPSLPNYVGATSGLPLSGLQQFTSDCRPSITCSTPSSSIFGQAASWKAYQESMPVDCDKANAGSYAVRHNPPPYFASLNGCGTFDVPFTALAGDLANNTLPTFSFITPNLNDDMHNGTITQGDTWLATNLPAILTSSAYHAGTVAVFLTWDEGGGRASTDCAANSTDPGCHVATIVASPSTAAATRSSTLYNHYSLLRTAEELLGLPLLGEAGSNNSMRYGFNL